MTARRYALRLALLAAALACPGPSVPAQAQLGALTGAGKQPVSSDQPVAFVADQVDYDRDRALVTASGHVEAWQNDRILRADRVVFDRNTNVAAATGHVVLLEPDGEVLFSDYAELAQGMKDGVLRGMRALLAENGRLAANGARRTDGKINELSRVVYSTCNLCAQDPTRAPLWQIRALNAVQDLEHKQVEYEDAVLDLYGIPVAYFPYMSHPDPSVKRASGFLIPDIGNSKHLGAFGSIPYYWVLDDKSDLTTTPTLTTNSGPQLELDYRLRLNEGTLSVRSSVAEDGGHLEGHIFANGRFDYNDTWRYGFDLNRASNSTYMRDFHIAGYSDVLTSQVYAEGFGQGAYARLDGRFYQGLLDNIEDAKLPVVAPRYEYSFFGQPDALGGRLSVDAGAFNVLRQQGANTQRANLGVNWERPAAGLLGDQWKLTLHGDVAAYQGEDQTQLPDFRSSGSVNTTRGLPQAAVEVRLPMMRDGGDTGLFAGNQVIEPIAQLVVAPNTGAGQINRVPNEDSLDLEFTDQNLFGFNRFPGIDRLDGGVRANVGLHSAWLMNGIAFDSLVGQSYRTTPNKLFPTGSGLNGTVSDIVARTSVQPTSWLDFIGRARIDHRTYNIRMAEALASVGTPLLTVTSGYLYSTQDPYFFYDTTPPDTALLNTPRNEVTLGASTSVGPWRASVYGRRNLQANQMVDIGAEGSYENECVIFDVRFNRRYTSVNNDHGETLLLFQVTLKTVGQFGYHAL